MAACQRLYLWSCPAPSSSTAHWSGLALHFPMLDDLSVPARLIGWTDPARIRRTVGLAIGPGSSREGAVCRNQTRHARPVAAIGAGAMAVTAGA